MSCHADPRDTPEMTNLISTSRELEGYITALRKAVRETEERLDAARLAVRPTYPTAEQLAGLEEATRRMSELIPAKSHHGDPTPTYAVVVDGKGRWLHIRHDSPNDRRGYSLWTFTDEEIEAFRKILMGPGHFWRIESCWRADGGVSFRVSG